MHIARRDLVGQPAPSSSAVSLLELKVLRPKDFGFVYECAQCQHEDRAIGSTSKRTVHRICMANKALGIPPTSFDSAVESHRSYLGMLGSFWRVLHLHINRFTLIVAFASFSVSTRQHITARTVLRRCERLE